MKSLVHISDIYYCLGILEKNNMNVSVTAKKLGKSRTTIQKYRKDYWLQYKSVNEKPDKETENSVEPDSIFLNSANLGQEAAKANTTHLYNTAVKRMLDIIKPVDGMTFKKKDKTEAFILTNLLKVITPVILPRAGEDLDNEKNRKKQRFEDFIAEFMQKSNQIEKQ